MTASEQRLGLGLIAVVVIGGAFMGLTKLKTWKQAVDASSLQIESRRLEADELMAQKEFWNERFAWLTEKQPVFTRRGDVDGAFLEHLETMASTHGVSIKQIQPIEPSERAGLISSTFTVQAQADWPTVNKWLHDLQQPDAFLSIPTLTMTPNEEDPTQVVVTMNVQRWLRQSL